MANFVPYHEPDLVAVLTLSSFIYLANVARWIADRLLYAGLLGEIVVGIIFGKPLGAILHDSWEQTFLALGYIGLLLIVFEGGLTTPLRKLVKALPLASIVALTGIGAPIALSFVLLPLGPYDTLEAFAAGAALSSTSLGTTFVVLKSVSGQGKDDVGNLEMTLLGTVLGGAAVIDDVVGFVLSSVIRIIGENTGSEATVQGWPIARPLVASFLFASIAPIVCTFFLLPLHRKVFLPHLQKPTVSRHLSLFLLIGVLSASVAISYVIGSSMLLGAYVAGLVAAALDDATDLPITPRSPSPISIQLSSRTASPSRDDPHPCPSSTPRPSPTPQNRPVSELLPTTAPSQHYFQATYERLIGPIQTYLFSPLFFASIGTAIPFLSLFSGRIIWRGIIYTLLMTFAKLLCGSWILVWGWAGIKNERRVEKKNITLQEEKGVEMTAAPGMEPTAARDESESLAVSTSHLERIEEEHWSINIWPALFLGLAMVARGEIGLLISQIGRVEAELLSEDSFLVATWAIVLCTIVGPVSVGVLIKQRGLKKVVPFRWR